MEPCGIQAPFSTPADSTTRCLKTPTMLHSPTQVHKVILKINCMTFIYYNGEYLLIILNIWPKRIAHIRLDILKTKMNFGLAYLPITNPNKDNQVKVWKKKDVLTFVCKLSLLQGNS